MKTPIADRDLTRQPPHSPRFRISDFVIAGRAVDKCRASLAARSGGYHYNCPLDNLLFEFKGITSEAFQAAVRRAPNYEDVGKWLESNGTPKTPAEIKAWSDEMERNTPMSDPARRAHFIQNCRTLGLNPGQSTTFDWLEADDRESFRLRG